MGQIEKKDTKFLNDIIKNKIKLGMHEILSTYYHPDKLQVKLKADHSEVTKIDLSISSLVKELFSKDEKLKNLNFYCEEDHGALSFPAVVLDPIDGTRELIHGIPECGISLAILYNENCEGEGWIYNPFTGFEIDNLGPITNCWQRRIRTPVGFVSQSEWGDGLYKNYIDKEDFVISPRGSMANKLLLLAHGGCDFVVTFRPKNIWDFAAGNLILKRQGVEFYEGHDLITKLDHQLYDRGTLIWVRPEYRDIVLKNFL